MVYKCKGLAGPTADFGLARRRGYAIMISKALGVQKGGKVEDRTNRCVSRGARLCHAGQRDIESSEVNGPTDRVTRQSRVGKQGEECRKGSGLNDTDTVAPTTMLAFFF